MELQIRIYRVQEGELARFVEEWEANVRPLREQLGFRVLSAWTSEEDDRFVWVLGYDGPDGFAAADARYYGSDERAALDPNPARLLTAIEHFMVTQLA
jgi:hypothetical protein